MMKWIVLAVVGALALLVLAIVIAGIRAPVRHVARVTLVLKKHPADIWSVVQDLGAWPTWNASIEKMERIADKDGHPVWALAWKGDTMPSEVLESTAPNDASPGRLVTRIADSTLPFGGTWTWEIAKEGGGTRIVITEDGTITNVVFRGMSSLFLGYTGTQGGYLGALAKRFGEDAKLEEHVEFP